MVVLFVWDDASLTSTVSRKMFNYIYSKDNTPIHVRFVFSNGTLYQMVLKGGRSNSLHPIVYSREEERLGNISHGLIVPCCCILYFFIFILYEFTTINQHSLTITTPFTGSTETTTYTAAPSIQNCLGQLFMYIPFSQFHDNIVTALTTWHFTCNSDAATGMSC